MALDQRGDVAVLRTADQVTLPVSRNSAILGRGGSFMDRDRIRDLTQAIAFEAGGSGAADRAFGTQVLQQFLLQSAAGLDIQAPIDRLV